MVNRLEKAQSDKKHRAQNFKNVIAAPQDVLLAAATLALTLSNGRSQYEIETLINLFSLTTDNLQALLAQILINKKTPDNIETGI